MKVPFKPGTLIYPLPAVMVSCGDEPENYNIITIAWTGTVCTDPPMCYISVRRERHSYDIIKRTGEFVINLTTARLARTTDWCGVRSGKDYNKLTDVRPLGSHDMFLANVVAVNADEKLIDKSTGAFQLNHAEPLAFSHGKYYSLGEKLGSFGFSVKKAKSRK